MGCTVSIDTQKLSKRPSFEPCETTFAPSDKNAFKHYLRSCGLNYMASLKRKSALKIAFQNPKAVSTIKKTSSRTYYSTWGRGCIGPPPPVSSPGSVAHMVAFDNPLLDILVPVDAEFLQKWALTSNGAILAGPEHVAMLGKICNRPNAQHIAGGSGLNTMRVAQWKLTSTCSSHPFHFVGTIADDSFGHILLREASRGGVHFAPAYAEDEEHKALSSGACAVLISGSQRSLVAYLGVSAIFQPEWILTNPKIRESVEISHYIYITGFFLRTSPRTCEDIAVISYGRRIVCFNLSAPFIVQSFTDLVEAFLPYCGIIFGNHEEYLALGRKLRWVPETSTDFMACARRVQEYEFAERGRVRYPEVCGGRLVIVTCGANPVVVCDTAKGTTTYEVPHVTDEEFVDTNGCGDAFVGGFLAEIVQQGRDVTNVAKACMTGIECAGVIIRCSGCSLPPPCIPEKKGKSSRKSPREPRTKKQKESVLRGLG